MNERESRLSVPIAERVASIRENLARAEACALDGSLAALNEGRGLMIDALFTVYKIRADVGDNFQAEVINKCASIRTALASAS